MGNGYETKAARTLLAMFYRNEYPAALPAGPRPRKVGEPEQDPPIYGGSVNHRAWAHAVRVEWAAGRGTASQRLTETLAAQRFLLFQLEVAFECWGRACEQTSPSHGQQNANAVACLLQTALRHGFADLAELATEWLLARAALAEPFVVEDDSLPGGLAVISPGARAFTDKERAGKPLVGGTCWLIDRFLGWRHGRPLFPGRKPDPLKSVDAAALFVLDGLPRDVAKRLREDHRPLPPLRWPVLLKRRGGDFVAWLPDVSARGEDDHLGVQRLAGWVEGRAVYGFDDSAEPDLVGAGDSILLRGREVWGGEAAPRPPLSGPPERPRRGPVEIASAMRELALRRPAARGELLPLADEVEALAIPRSNSLELSTGNGQRLGLLGEATPAQPQPPTEPPRESWTGPLLAQMQEQMRQVADRLMGDFCWLAGLAALLPRSSRETSKQDLDEDPDPATELRAVALCVMADYLRPAITDLLDASRHLPGPTSPSGAEILRRLCEVLGTLGAAGGGEGKS